MMKIFNVGLGKTATMSVDLYFKNMNYATLHCPRKFTSLIVSYYEIGGFDILFNKNYYSDIFVMPGSIGAGVYDKAIFRNKVIKTLKDNNVKIFATIRDKEDWINSMIKHVERNVNRVNYIDKRNYPILDINTDLWSKEYDDHCRLLKEYGVFTIDVCKDDRPYHLCNYLEVDCYNNKFPHINQS